MVQAPKQADKTQGEAITDLVQSYVEKRLAAQRPITTGQVFGQLAGALGEDRFQKLLADRAVMTQTQFKTIGRLLELSFADKNLLKAAAEATGKALASQSPDATESGRCGR